MPRASIFDTWTIMPQRRPVSHRNVNVNVNATLGVQRPPSKKWSALTKLFLWTLLAALVYYYTSSESLLDKYGISSSTSIYNIKPSSRVAFVVDDGPLGVLSTQTDTNDLATTTTTNAEAKPEATSFENKYRDQQVVSKIENRHDDNENRLVTQETKILIITANSSNETTTDFVDQSTPSTTNKEPSSTTAITKRQRRRNNKRNRPASTLVEDNDDPQNASTAATVTSDSSTSYLHYIGCCGIGHRLARMSNAYHAARRLNFALQATWPSCNKTNVFEYLFEPDYIHRAGWSRQNYTRSGHVLSINNEVPGYTSVSRVPEETGVSNNNSNNNKCDMCHAHKIEADYQFYNSLLQRFRKRHQVYEFMKRHNFANHTVIGMHIRAGNGEGGDFEVKDRGIANTTLFVDRVHTQIVSMIQQQHWKDPPLVFVATDTPAMLEQFQQAFSAHSDATIPVVELPHQIRPSQGQGILFGERNKGSRHTLNNDNDNGEQNSIAAPSTVDAKQSCLLGWDQAFMDMMILASSDVVVATRRSSFVQTIPLSMAVGRPAHQRKVPAPYCEISQDSSLQMTCHETYMDWCCCTKCLQQEEQERRIAQKPLRNPEYIKQLRPDLWNVPVMELYQTKLKRAKRPYVLS